MRELGYVVGKNLVIEWRSAEGKSERLPGLAAELVRLKIDVLATAGTPATVAAQKATSAIPIVMINAGDPVGSGLVKSLARPAGNSTGLSIMTAELGPKLLEMLAAMTPKVTLVAVLLHPANDANLLALRYIEAAAVNLGIKILPIEARTPKDIADGFALMAGQRTEALIVPLEGLFQQQKNQILALLAKQRLPSIAAYHEYVEAGGLISYGQNVGDSYRRAATYIDKIFRGANPGELPVEQPTKFELFVNMKTAKALGIKVPNSILVQATKVIE
jgi:putative ABC transport system substrate-binding protein